MEVILREYQSNGLQASRTTYKKGFKAPIFVSPTGSGKTFTFCVAAKLALERGNPTMIIVPKEEILYQTSGALKTLGVKHGLIKAGLKMDPTALVQVASAQTLVNRLHLPWLKKFNFVIIDEAHHAIANTWRKILDFYKEAWLLGATATPCRADGKGLGLSVGGIFDTLVEGPSIRELINQGHLCDFDYFAPNIGVDLTGVKRQGGDYAKEELAAVMDQPTITGCAVEHYHRMSPGRPAIAFCVNVAHSQHVAEQFRASGYRALSIDGNTKRDIRKEAISNLGSGDLDVLCSCDIVSEGTDVPIVEVSIQLRPTHSLSLFLQQNGRVLRPVKGKRALMLDHVNNWHRHGFPDDIHEWSLDGIKKKTKRELKLQQIKLRQCTKCYKVDSPPKDVCSHCGYIHPVSVRELKEKEGELVEVTPEMKEELKRQKEREKQARRSEEWQAKTLEQLTKLAHSRGYKNPEGWAYHRYNCRKTKK